MRPSHWIENLYCRTVDHIYRRLPQPASDVEQLRRCKIIAHRGVCNGAGAMENTLKAFDRALALGIWGIELDIRWTRDLVPVVYHDPDTHRLFRADTQISQATHQQLSLRFPQIPSLEDVVQRYGKHLHLMIEIKQFLPPNPQRQYQILRDLLAGLEPGLDYHLISMTPELFRGIHFVPNDTFLPIAQLNIAHCSRLAIQWGYAGILGHYTLVRNPVIARHHRAGQRIGTGFVNSLGCLFRELNREVEWIFTDQAVTLQSECRASRKSALSVVNRRPGRSSSMSESF